MTNKENHGIGMATAIAYAVPLRKILPSSPGGILVSEWEEIGAINGDGISYSSSRDLILLCN